MIGHQKTSRRGRADFPELPSIERRITDLLERNRKVAVDFVLTELTVGLRFCRQLRGNPSMTEEQKAWHTAQAHLALETAEATMWKLRLSHPEFDQMMALAERLKFEIDALQLRYNAAQRLFNTDD